MDEVAQPQEEHGNGQHQQPQLPGEAHPFGVADGCQPKGDEQDRVGGVSQVGKAIPEAVGSHGELARNAHQVRQRQQDGHHQHGFGAGGSDEELDHQRQQVNDQHRGERGRRLQSAGCAVEDGIHHLPGSDNVLDAGSHQQQGDAGCNTADAFQQRFTDCPPACAGNHPGRQPAGEEEDAHQRQGVIGEEPHERAGEEHRHDQEHESAKDQGSLPQPSAGNLQRTQIHRGITCAVRLAFLEDQ